MEQQQQYAIIEYISHLVSEQFDQVPNDLVNLGEWGRPRAFPGDGEGDSPDSLN